MMDILKTLAFIRSVSRRIDSNFFDPSEEATHQPLFLNFSRKWLVMLSAFSALTVEQ